MSEPTTHPVEAINQLVRSQLLDVNTCLLGEIVQYEAGLATVQPLGHKRYADGEHLEYPIINNVRVLWPSFNAGKSGIKGPIKEGDPCLLIFSQQSIDDPEDRRMFDLSDAVCLMCNLGEAVEGDTAQNDELTIYHNKAYIRISEAGKITVEAPGQIAIKAPKTTITGDFEINGTTTHNGSTTLNGSTTHSSGTLTSLGKNISGTHTHGGVTTGGGNTAVPN